MSSKPETAKGRPKIKLYVDTVSPFAYEAYYVFRNDNLFKACDITYVPIFLGGLMKTCGNTAPIRIKNKDKWIVAERLRWARAFSVPMAEELPPDFPAMTLATMRALCALTHMDGEDQSRLIRALDLLFYQHWAEHRRTHDPAVFQQALREALGDEDTKTVMETLGTEGKRILTENTERAFADGAFGLPWMVCMNREGETEGFWGVDHLGQVVQFLGLQKPQDGGWRALL